VTIHAAASTTRSTGSNRSIGRLHLALVALVFFPAIAGSLRLVEVAGAEYVIRRSVHRGAIISRPTINSRSIRATVKVGSS
jgi:hypothetical protein